jgi:hypothetical protein
MTELQKTLAALDAETCDDCGHAWRHHNPKYGCEVERGDGYIGTSDVLQALGPCGCTAVKKEDARDIEHEQISGSTTEQLLARRDELVAGAIVGYMGCKLYALPKLRELQRIASELYCRANGIESQPWVTFSVPDPETQPGA